MKFDMKYYNTYYYCNIACNIIQYGRMEWAVSLAQFSEPFFEEKPNDFDKCSALHSFCYHLAQQVIHEDMEEELNDIVKRYDKYSHLSKTERIKKSFEKEKFFDDEEPEYVTLEIERAMEQYNSKYPKFISWLIENEFILLEDAIMEYIWENEDIYDDTLEHIANEMFYILYQNRDFLLHFNYYLSLKNPYQMQRVYIPEWVKRAVFFRDRGNCALCGKDLSGLKDICDDNEKHYDHIIPLSSQGLNDVSNIQLLCSNCNHNKGGDIDTNQRYTNWYDL